MFDVSFDASFALSSLSSLTSFKIEAHKLSFSLLDFASRALEKTTGVEPMSGELRFLFPSLFLFLQFSSFPPLNPLTDSVPPSPLLSPLPSTVVS